MRRRGTFRLAALAFSLALSFEIPARGDDARTEAPPTVKQRPDVVYVPTPPEVVERMLALAELKPNDVVYDLGCGDGRVVVAAAMTYGVKAVGLDVDPKRVAESLENVRKNDVADRVTIRRQDFFDADLSGASVVTLYLVPNLNARLKPQLARLKPGSRVVSHSFGFKGVKPTKVERVRLANGGERTIYLFVMPWDDETGR